MTKDRPLIGINADYRSTKGRTPFSVLHSGYYDILLAANALPIILPPLTKEHDLAPILDRLDGIILTGGDDLDPKKMGLTPHPSITLMAERRETADRLLCKLVQQRKMPVLAIGVGMQELNILNGGGNYLHLPEDLPKSIPHRDPQGGGAPAHRHHGAGHADRRDLRPRRDSGQQLPPPRGPQARSDLPRRRARSRRPDRGATRAKTPPGGSSGVQWHPENEGNISLDTQLIEAFTEAAGALEEVARAGQGELSPSFN